MKKLLPYTVFSLIIIGCSSIPKQWSALDGSKSDGTVTLTYVYRPILDTKPIKNDDANDLALSKCALWGYVDAQAFGGEVKSCNSSTSDGSCTSWRITKTYQCTSR